MTLSPGAGPARAASSSLAAGCALVAACGGVSAEARLTATGARALEVPPALLLAVAQGDQTLASLVREQEGVIVVALTAEGDGARSERAERLCGDALAVLVLELEAHLRLSAEGTEPPACAGAWCVDAPLVEFDPARHYRFEDGPSGPRVAAVYLIDEAGVPEELVEVRRRRAADADRALRGAPCGASGAP